MTKFITFFLIAVLSFGCSNVKPIKIENSTEPLQILHPPLPDPLVWESVEWKVLTVDTMREIIKQVDVGKISERDAVFFAVTPSGYERLALNMAEIKRLLEGQKSVIMYYRTTVPEHILVPKK